MLKIFLLTILTLALILPHSCLVESNENGRSYRDVNARLQDLKKLKDLDERDVLGDDELFNKLFPYDSMSDSKKGTKLEILESVERNMIKPAVTYGDLEHEQSKSSVKVEPSTFGVDGYSKSSPDDLDKVKSVAFNSREVRLIGPDQREVEMKDDFATKLAIVMDNLKQETSELIDTVNDKFDKGWNDFVKMVEKVTTNQKKQQDNNN